MRKEIEVKAKVANLSIVIKKLEALGCVVGPVIEQDDQIFVNFTDDFATFKPGENFLRIRKAKGKVLFTLKQPHKNEMDCTEHEVEVDDAGEMEQILLCLGYHEAAQVNKKRMKTKYQDMEICLDEVAILGSFIEVEKITEETDGEQVQEELFTFLETLGVERKDRVLHGYDTMVYLKKHNRI